LEIQINLLRLCKIDNFNNILGLRLRRDVSFRKAFSFALGLIIVLATFAGEWRCMQVCNARSHRG